jgi:hypothetical protein
MSYFMRYILVHDDIALQTIDQALNAIDPGFSVQFDQGEPDSGDLYYRGEVLGEISVNHPGEMVFSEDIEELRTVVNALDHPDTPLIQTTLDSARAMVALLVLEAGHRNPDIVDQLWDWLFDHYRGVLQVDDEGYYDRDELVLPTTPDEH